MDQLDKIAPFAKAILAALISFLTALITGLEDGSISATDWLTAVIALLIAGGAVFSVPNKPPFTPEPDPTEYVRRKPNGT